MIDVITLPSVPRDVLPMRPARRRFLQKLD
jgi:hypothetical protein